jgi:hypothetical protein
VLTKSSELKKCKSAEKMQEGFKNVNALKKCKGAQKK